MGKSSDQLRQEIDQQRADAGAKIDHLQQQVEGQIEGTREQVVEGVEHVRDEAQAMVTDTVDSVKHSIENLDIERHVQERPLASVGAALVAHSRGQRVVGLENNTSFIRAVRSGVLHAVARPVTRGRTTQVWEAHVRDADERLIAQGRVRLLCLSHDALA